MNLIENTKSLLQSALAGVDSSDQNRRLAIYKAAIKAAESLPEAAREKCLQQISQAITELEIEYQPTANNVDHRTNASGNSNPSDDVEYKEPQISPLDRKIVSPPSQEHQEPLLSDAPEHISSIDHLDNITPRKSKFSEFKATSKTLDHLSLSLIVGVLVAIIGLVVISWVAWQNFGSPTPNSENSSDVSVEKSTSAEDLVQLLESRFPLDLKNWKTGSSDKPSPADIYADFIEGNDVVVKDKLRLFSNTYLPIKTKNIYVMKIEMTLLEDGKLWPRLNAGVATFDKNKKLLRSKPGTHRYFISRGSIKKPAGITAGESFELSAIITDAGDGSHREFRPGTEFVKPLMIFSVSEETAKLRLNSISFSEIPE